MAAAGGFSHLAALYRQVLRVNRDKLPGPLRMLGDGYAAEEFRRHITAKTTDAQWLEFGKQWQAYVSALRETQPELVPDIVQLDLTPEQREQMEQLKQAAFDVARGDGKPPSRQTPPTWGEGAFRAVVEGAVPLRDKQHNPRPP